MAKIIIRFENQIDYTQAEYTFTEDGYELYLALMRILGLMTRNYKNETSVDNTLLPL